MKKSIYPTVLLSLFGLALLSAYVATDSPPLYTNDLYVLDDGNVLLANRSAKDLRLCDANGGTLRRWAFDDPVTSVTADGERVYITSSYSQGYLYCIDLVTGEELYKTPTGMGATSAVLSADKSKVYVCNRYKTTVSEVDASSGELLREVALLREPCAAAVTPDGKYLLVNNFLPTERADLDFVAADVSVIDLSTFQHIKSIKLANGSNALRDIAVSPDGKFAYVSHNLGRYQVPTSQLQQGWMNTSAMSVIDLESMSYVGPVLLDDPDRGAAGVWGVAVDDRHIIVAQSGTHDVSVVDRAGLEEKLAKYDDPEVLAYDLYIMRDIRRRLPVDGNGPRSVMLKDGKVYVVSFFTDNISVIDLASQELEKTIAYNPGRTETSIDVGERVFNDAEFCYQNWQSCNGCHPNEARMDGMNWDLMNDGIGNPKNCKSLLYSHVTPPNMISGIRAQAEIAVRAGFTHIQFSQIPEDLAVAVDDYLKSLEALPSPYLRDGELSDKAKAGQIVYQQLGCDVCHYGEYYTDMRMHRIGDDIEFEAGWDTPTLREVWRTAPYLFDGRAATMEDVFREHRHGINGDISDRELGELVEYVNSL